MMSRFVFRRASGVSLIELIVFIVIVSVAIVGVLSVLNLTAAKSANPVLRKQALALAEATMEEVLSHSYQNDPADPNNVSTTLGCTKNTTTPSCKQNTTVTQERKNYNDVDDYNTWDQAGAYRQDGTLAAVALGTYRVKIDVVDGVTLNTANPVTAKKVTVTVTGGAEPITLVGYRTLYD